MVAYIHTVTSQDMETVGNSRKRMHGTFSAAAAGASKNHAHKYRSERQAIESSCRKGQR
tara:strand:+ start:802 stop:978 length:177 start_codon:yes stop_codon:yes gene_type:complete